MKYYSFRINYKYSKSSYVYLKNWATISISIASIWWLTCLFDLFTWICTLLFATFASVQKISKLDVPSIQFLVLNLIELSKLAHGLANLSEPNTRHLNLIAILVVSQWHTFILNHFQVIKEIAQSILNILSLVYELLYFLLQLAEYWNHSFFLIEVPENSHEIVIHFKCGVKLVGALNIFEFLRVFVKFDKFHISLIVFSWVVGISFFLGWCGCSVWPRIRRLNLLPFDLHSTAQVAWLIHWPNIISKPSLLLIVEWKLGMTCTLNLLVLVRVLGWHRSLHFGSWWLGVVKVHYFWIWYFSIIFYLL